MVRRALFQGKTSMIATTARTLLWLMLAGAAPASAQPAASLRVENQRFELTMPDGTRVT